MSRTPAGGSAAAPVPARVTRITLAITFIVVSSVLFAPLSQTATKFLAGEFPLFQILFFRSLGQTAWMVIFFWHGHGLRMFKAKRPGIQMARSTLLFVSTLLWTSVIAQVPLTTASAINFTAPVMVVLLSIPFLGERVGRHRWSAVIVGFLGAVIIIQPGPDGISMEMLMLLGAAFLFSVYQILTRKVTAIDSAATTSLYTVLVALVVSAMVVPWHYVSPEPGEWLIWLAFAATGLLGGIRHYFVVKAYEHAPASVISPFFYCELVGVTALGFFVFGDFPDHRTWLGAAIIVASGLYIAHRERVRKPT
ncbi:MAG: DMT family transporter [Chromatiales bacterium]|nr:DMT family transporter [Chromatiales bacterium]